MTKPIEYPLTKGVLDVLCSFSFDRPGEFDRLTQNAPVFRDLIRWFLSKRDGNGHLKEVMICHEFSLIHNTRVHGFDAIVGSSEPVEIKSVSMNPLNGHIDINMSTTDNKLTELRKKNPWFYIAGFVKGRCAFVVRVKYLDTDMDSHLGDHCRRAKKTRNISAAAKPGFRYIFANPEKVEVLFYNPGLKNCMTRNLRNFFETRYEAGRCRTAKVQ